MGNLQDTLKGLESKLNAIKHEAVITSSPHLLRAGIESAITTLNQAIILSQMGKIEGEPGHEKSRKTNAVQV